jgi:hypothetical protein
MFFKGRMINLPAQNSFYENKKYPVDPWSYIFIGWLRQGSNACRGGKRQLPALQTGKIRLIATKQAANGTFKHRKFFHHKCLDGFYRLFGLLFSKPCF